MPKTYGDSVQVAFWKNPVMGSMLSHTVSWLEVASDDPDILILCKGQELARFRLSQLAGIDPRAAAAYSAFQFLFKGKDLLKLERAPEVVLAERLNPSGERLPFKFRYAIPFLRRSRIDKVLEVEAITPYNGTDRPTVEVHIG